MFPSFLFLVLVYFVSVSFFIPLFGLYLSDHNSSQYLLMLHCPFIFELKVSQLWLKMAGFTLEWSAVEIHRSFLLDSVFPRKEASDFLSGGYKAHCQVFQSWSRWVKRVKDSKFTYHLVCRYTFNSSGFNIWPQPQLFLIFRASFLNLCITDA